MRLPTPFVKLPIAFDATMLAGEALQFAEAEWRVHPQDYPGNSALILVSHDGTDNDDSFGTMAATPRLQLCPYLKQVIASFGTVIGRSRLMRLAPGAEVKPHSDIAYYWRDHIRIHVPIVTDSGVRFVCDGIDVHMAAGEAWIFDNWRPHYVLNHTQITRIHLVIDTVGNSSFWRLVAQGTLVPQRPNNRDKSSTSRTIVYEPEKKAILTIEQHNLDPVAHPDTVKNIVQDLLSDLRQSNAMHPSYGQLELLLAELSHEWRSTSATYARETQAYSAYRQLVQHTLDTVRQKFSDVRLPSNGLPIAQILNSYLPALLRPPAITTNNFQIPRFDRPIIILSAPRSGSTLLYETLSRHPHIWSLGDESHGEIENLPGLSPTVRGYISNVLGTSDASPQISASLRRIFAERMWHADGQLYREIPVTVRPNNVRFLEKTPKNALRVAFLNAIFPDAYFIFLHRDPRPNLASMIEAWRSGKFITYRTLPGWEGLPWSLLLIPDWQNLPPHDLAMIVARQWVAANAAILEGLSCVPKERWRSLSYEELTSTPAEVINKLFAFCNLEPVPFMNDSLDHKLPLSRYTLTPPSNDKWQLYAKDIGRVIDMAEPVHTRILELGNRL
jgi:Sulfotransferase family/Aspartyl/Asparaginyl beta-hydroxylase